jgi:hypothetical protein
MALLLTSLAWGAPHHPKVLLMDLPTTGAFDANVIKVVNSFLAKDLRNEGFDVITPTDIGAALGFERQKQMMGCSETSCLAEIGGAMGADYIVHGEMASLEHNTALTLTLTDTRGQALNQIADVVKGKEAEALLDALNRDVPKLVEPIRASLQASRTEAPTTAAGGLTTSTDSATSSGSSNAAAYTLLGVGGVGLITSGIFGFLSYSSYQSYGSDGLAGRQSALANDQQKSNTYAAVAWGGLAVGIAGAAIGTWFLLSSPSEPSASTP